MIAVFSVCLQSDCMENLVGSVVASEILIYARFSQLFGVFLAFL